MVSPDKLKKSKDAKYDKLQKNKYLQKKRKSWSVLKSKKLYLSFKNLSLQSKWEIQLSNLGALTVQFIDKDVNYVITDLPGYNGKPTSIAEASNTISPQCYSISPATSVSGDDPSTAKKPRKRADAMLEKVSVRTQGISSVNNPITLALSWKIPVYSIDIFQNLLNKKLAQIQLVNESDETKHDKSVRVFHKRYLKLEHVVDRKYRPEFREVSKWPSIDLNTEAGTCPFDSSKSSKKAARRERKHGNKKNNEKMNRICNKTANESGYCEICAVHYDDLSQHVTTSTHLKFVCNDKHYAELDNCIKTRSVEAFLASHNLNDTNSRMKELNTNEDMGRNLRKSVSLHLNNNNENSAVTRSLTNAKLLADESLKQPLQVQCNGFTNYHLRKSTIKSDSSVVLKSPSVYGNHAGNNNKDVCRETRKMYASCPDGNKMSQKDLAHLSPVDEVDGPHRLRSRKNLLLPAILIGTTAEDSNKSRTLLSPHTPTSNHFLRSSSSPKLCTTGGRTRAGAGVGEDCNKKSPPTLNAKHPNPLNLHYTRSANKMNCVSPCENDKRTSRLSASPRDETRVNGKPSFKRKCSLTTSDDDETSRNNVPSYHCNKSNHLCIDSAEHNGHNRKRMSTEEKFLEDNKEYYKVEVLPSKLRSTEFYCTKETDQVSRREDLRTEHANRKQLMAALDSESRRLSSHKRQSALHLLNLEATNFMFGPPKRDDSSEESNDDETTGCARNSDVSPREVTARVNDKMKTSTPSAVAVNRRGRGKERKRRTHAEVFIHDNLDYYKFEISDSRLRHQSSESEHSAAQKISPCSAATTATATATTATATATTATATATTTTPTATKATAKVTTTTTSTTPSDKIKVKEEEEDGSPQTPVVIRRRGRGKRKTASPPADETTEITPVIQANEPETQPEIKEEPVDGESLPDYCDRPAPPTDSVQFAFESVPAHESWYKAFQRFDQCEEQYIPIPHTVYFSRYRDVVPFQRRRDPDKRSIGPSPGGPSSSKDNSLLAHFRRKRRSRLSRFIIDDKPRKSPRCHASTLAILSSLTGNRRRSRKLLASLEFAANNKPGVARHSLNRSAELEASKSLLAEVTQEYQKKLKETVHVVAKNIDQHFIDVFKDDDCEDTYLKKMKVENESGMVNGENIDWHCCMHIDDEIFRDEELIRSLMSERSDKFDNMSTFLENSQNCTSMEAAQDEELMAARSNDMLARLYRENDMSCNSSDCGASSTCEFLGFAEDGRTVSRKRKRKRPNMTGWPHDRNKRRQMRMLRVRGNTGNDRNGEDAETNDLNGGTNGDGKVDPGSVNVSETVSEAESECTDDDIQLNELGLRKRRRTNNSLSAASDAIEMKKNEAETVNGERESPSSRRASKAASSSHSSPRKNMPVTRRKSLGSSTVVRRNRCI